MGHQQLDTLLAEIRAIRTQVLSELNNLTEAEFNLRTDRRDWKWDTLLRVLLQFGNHMREHATHIQGTRANLERLPSQPQRILGEAEVAWGRLLAAVVGLNDADLDRVPEDGGASLRRILEHIRNSEQAYLDAIREARTKQCE